MKQYLGPEPGGVYCGIDPGMEGAIAFFGQGPLDTPEFFTIYDMPTIGDKKQRTVDAPTLGSIIKQFKPDVVVVEKVHAMRGWGSGSTFRFGKACGVIEGVLGALSIPMRQVAPQTWKKHFDLKGGNKEASRKLVMQRWPDHQTLFARVKDHNRSEAALLAVYGKEVF